MIDTSKEDRKGKVTQGIFLELQALVLNNINNQTDKTSKIHEIIVCFNVFPWMFTQLCS